MTLNLLNLYAFLLLFRFKKNSPQVLSHLVTLPIGECILNFYTNVHIQNFALKFQNRLRIETVIEDQV